MKYFLVRENFIFVCLLLSIVFPMHRNNVCHEFLLFYHGHSMKSRRSQSIGIKGFFNERNIFNRKLNSFLQRSRNAMTVNVIIYINNTVVKAAKSDKINKDLFYFFANSTEEGCYQQKLPLQPYSSTLIDMWLFQAVG